MADSRKIVYEIELDDSGAVKGFNKLESDAAVAGKTAGKNLSKGFTKSLKGLGANALGALRSNIAGAVAGFAGFQALKGSISLFSGFERSIAEINTLLPDTAQLTSNTTKAFRDMSKEFGQDATTQAGAFYQIVSAGVKTTSKQLDVLRQSNKAATAGLVDVKTSADALTSVMNAYAKSGLTAQQASDSLFVAVREGKTTFGELANTIGRVAPIAQAAGVSFQDLTGGLAFITKAGLSTDEAVTGLRAILSAVIKPAKEALTTAKKLGIEFSTAAIRMKGFGGFLQDLAKKTGGSEEILAKLVPNVRGLGPVLQIARGDLADFNRTLDATNNSFGSTDKAAGKIKKTLDFKLDQSIQEVKELGLAFGKVLAPTLKLVLGLMSDVLTFGDKLANRKVFGDIEGQLKPALARIQELEKKRGAINPIDGNAILEAQKLDDQIKKLTFKVAGLGAVAGMSDKQLVAYANNLNTPLRYMNDQLAQTNAKVKESTNKMKNDFNDLSNTVKPVAEETTFSLGELFRVSKEGFLSGTEGVTDSIASMRDEMGKSESQLKEKMGSLAKASKKMGDDFKKGIGQGMAAGFSSFGAALVKGEDALGAFAKSFLSTLGQMMVQQGAAFILQGLGFEVIPGLQASGATLVATGAALAALGGAMSAVGSSGASTGSSAAAGGSAYEGDIGTTFDAEDTEERQTGQQVVVNVEGNVIDTKRTFGLEVAEALKEAFEEDGVVAIGVNA